MDAKRIRSALRRQRNGERNHGATLLCVFVYAGLLTGAGAYPQSSISPNCPGDPSVHLSGSPTFVIAAQEGAVTEGEDAVFTLRRRGAPGPCQRVRVRISGHEKIMSPLTKRLQVIEVVFQPGATTRTLRLPTESDTRNEGDGEIRATIVGSSGLSYTIGHPNHAAVRVRDDDIPEVTFHAVSPAGLTLAGDTWVGDILEGNKVRFETRCSGEFEYSHPRSFLPLVDHAHEFNHPMIPSYNVAGFVFTPCDREHDFLVRQDQAYTGPAGGEIRAVLLSSSDIESRWVDGRVQHDDGGRFHYFACSERDFGYCPRYTVGTPNALRLSVRNMNPTITVAAEHDQVDEGEAARFVITRHWDHPALFDDAQPSDPAVKTRIGYRVMHAGTYVAAEYIGAKERDGFNLTVHEYAVEIPTLDDATRRADGSVTLELLPDSFPDVNVGGTYELYESIPGITPPGQSSIRATVTISDNDPDPIVGITDAGDGGGGASIEFTVSLNHPSDLPITVDWVVTAVGAPPGGEPVATGSITFAAGETTQTIGVPISGGTPGQPDRTYTVTLSNPVNAVFADDADGVAAQVTIQEEEQPGEALPAPTVTAVPDTAGNLMVTWEAPDGPPPTGYEVTYRSRGTGPWESGSADGLLTHLPILFLDQDTEYEARVRAHYVPEAGMDDSTAHPPTAWSASGFGRTGVHQPDSEPVVTLALADSGPATEGGIALLHVAVSELRNSYRWHGLSDGIVVDLDFAWRKRGSGLVVSSQFGIVPGVFTVDHGLGGYRDYRVWLPDSAADHGPLTLTLQPGAGYRVGEAASVCVSIADSETMEATPCPDSEDISVTRPGTRAAAEPVAIEVRDARTTEGVDQAIAFGVTLSRAAPEEVTVDWSTADGTARAGDDYVASSGTLTFAAGETEHAIAVTVLDDAHDEGEETFALRLSAPAGAVLGDAEATGTIVNSDPLPRAWLGRFGRTAWEHALGAVDERLRSARRPVTRAAVAGRSVAGAPPQPGAGEEQRMAALAAWIGAGSGEPKARAMSGQQLLDGSEFQVATAASEGRGVLTVWGQGAYGRFAGQDDDLAVHGEVASGTLGVDYAAGPWLSGLALSHSAGWGSYAQPETRGGEVTSSLTGAYPYVSYELVPERLALWLAGGYGLGGLRLAPSGGEPLETGIGLLAGAAGARGTLLTAAASGGFSLGLNADGLLLRATSEATAGLAATTAEVNRLRLGLEAAYELAVGGGARLTPSVEVAVRRDDGLAEAGFGIDLGGGLRYQHPRLGLSFGLRGRALVVHETPQPAEWGVGGWLAWDPNPASELGPSLTVSPSLGARAEGGAAALWSRDTLAGLAGDPAGADGAGRIDARFGYGMPLAGGVGVPWAGVGVSESERAYRFGYAFQVGDPATTALRVELEAARRERATAAEPEHILAVHSRVSW